MRRNAAPAGTATRSPHRLRPMLAMATLAALTLTACGTEEKGAGGPQSDRAGTSGVGTGAAFTEMLDKVARQCPPERSAGGAADRSDAADAVRGDSSERRGRADRSHGGTRGGAERSRLVRGQPP